MPRGTRAVIQTGGINVHTDAGTYSGHVVESFLVTVCWCGESFWLVDRRDVLELRAIECGRAGCVAPPSVEVIDRADGIEVMYRTAWHPAPPGYKRGRRTIERLRVASAASQIQDAVVALGAPSRGLVYGPTYEPPPVRSPVALRRARVLDACRRGLTMTQCAAALSITYTTVGNDSNALRRAGFVVDWRGKARRGKAVATRRDTEERGA